MMSPRFELKHPLPTRGVYHALREQIVEHLVRERPPLGEKFLSDAEMVRVSGLSRVTVRRALDDLQREGWIERRHGQGTFVGPRVALSLRSRRGTALTGQAVVRLGVIASVLDNRGTDWYSGSVLHGIDQAADEQGIVIELLSVRGASDIHALLRRLEQSRPDVLAVLTAMEPRHVFAIGQARRLGIPCIGTGTRVLMQGVPAVCEDGIQGTELAVHHLVEHGHRRIGFLQAQEMAPWVFERREGYRQGLVQAGIEPDENLVLWLDTNPETRLDQIDQYLNRYGPTALVCGAFSSASLLGRLVKAGRLRIPQDVSVVVFDQYTDGEPWLDDRRPTLIAQPLEAMGRHLALLARKIQDEEEYPHETRLPCTLIEGASVAPPTGS